MDETRQLIEGFKAAKELTDLFSEARDRVVPIQELFVKTLKDNDPKMWLEAINAVCELGEDSAIGGLIVTMGVLARIKVGLEGTDCYDKVKELFTSKVF